MQRSSIHQVRVPGLEFWGSSCSNAMAILRPFLYCYDIDTLLVKGFLSILAQTHFPCITFADSLQFFQSYHIHATNPYIIFWPWNLNIDMAFYNGRLSQPLGAKTDQ